MKIHYKIHNVEQGSEEWRCLRTGVISGTDAGPFIIEPRKINLTVPQLKKELDGKGIAYTSKHLRDDLIAILPNAESYMEISPAARSLILAKITDKSPKDEWQLAMDEKIEKSFLFNIPVQRGKALEPFAKAFYERLTGYSATEVGFVSDSEMNWGISPDGLIYEKGELSHGLEIKCVMPAKHREWILDDKIPNEHVFQVEMGMAITGLDRWDFLAFCPGEAALYKVARRSHITDQLRAGLEIMAEERKKIEGQLHSIWKSQLDGNRHLMTHRNGSPMFSMDGTMLDADGCEIVLSAEDPSPNE